MQAGDHELTRLIGAGPARAIAGLAESGALPSGDPDHLDALIGRLAGAPGNVARLVGSSSAGRPITMLSTGTGSRSVLAWGYPHPDEPLGAMALAWLAERVSEGDPALSALARFHLVFCADPDGARINRAWAESPSLENLLSTIRPEHLAREADYGFPVRYGPFEQPDDLDGARACHEAARCVEPWICGVICRRHGLPAGPSAESLALANAIRITRPDLVASCHDTVVGGCFTFILHPPGHEALDALRDIPGALGLARQLGQKIDHGRPWRPGEIDLIREPRIEGEALRFLRRPGIDPQLTYLGCVSAAQHLQSVLPTSQFIVPEAPHLSTPAFGDTTPLTQTRELRLSHEARRRGMRWCLRGVHLLPDGTAAEILYRMSESAPAYLPVRRRVGPLSLPVSVGMLGMEAVADRRWALSQVDALYRGLPAWLRDSDHPIAAERRALRTPAAHVNDRSQQIFRLSPYTDRAASVAHQADFTWRWSIETARWAGQLARLIDDEGGPQDARERLGRLIGQLTGPLPQTMRRSEVRPAGAASQLARIVAMI
ncbi:hypothetical protein [Miltoncostaea oceani]|uniref:hypothetical protein n=1 Tax=Miltoncostaea oceani TaxID=2843216 RepID=UPI001C3DF011|nr:hypothetical protein [Miltoncostaea oceani]